MILKLTGYSCVRAIARFSSSLLWVLLLAGCSPVAETTTEVTAEVTTEAKQMGPVDARTPPTGAAPAGLTVALDLAEVPGDLPDAARLFVFVRQPGQRMPLAVRHYPLAEAPSSVSFATTQPHVEVEVVARVSPSGVVEKQAEDLEVLALVSPGHPASRVTLSFSDSIASAAPVDNRVVVVDLDYVGAESLSPDTRVFVVAKSSASPMPLAVKSLTLGELPLQVELRDSDSMLPTRTLSSAADIGVSAHVSRSGDASRQPGDWVGYAKPGPKRAGANDMHRYSVLIDQRIQ